MLHDCSLHRSVPDQAIDFIHNMSKFVIGISWGKLQFQDKAIYLINAHGHCQPLLHCMLDQPLRIQHNLWETE